MLIHAAALAAALSLPAAAQDATLDKVSGPVHVRPGGSGRFAPAQGGEELIFGDEVKTGPGGLAHLVLKDRGAVLIRENTQLTLQGSPSETTLWVPLGEFLVGLKKRLEQGASFKVRTPAAVAAVRGTLFWGRTDESRVSTYAGFGHEVEITARKRSVILKPWQKVTVGYGAPPNRPVASDVSLEYAANFAIDGSLEGLEALAEPKPAASAPKPK